MPVVSVTGVMAIVGQVITTAYDLLPTQPFASVALRLKLKVPAKFGVPLRMPVLAFSVTPEGSVPELSA